MGVCNVRKTYGIHIFVLASSFFCLDFLNAKNARSLRSQSAFGRTHFIRGFPSDVLKDIVRDRSKGTRSGQDTKSELRVLFAPDDNLQKEMVQLIKAEQKSIKIAIYLFTNKRIAEELIRAHDRGVCIEVVIDGSSANVKYSKIDLLRTKSGIFICEYQAKPGFNGHADSIMHNKFVIFECNKGGHSLVWTGSYNFTVRATRKNQENAVISNDILLVEHFKKQFERLKRRC